jgi:hypothetical protein
MKSSATLFPIALALGAVTLAPWARAQAQDSRQEGPIEIEKCQTISQPGSYRLVNNLTLGPAGGTCLLITADFVTIDLAGFAISGPTSFNSENQPLSTAIAAEVNASGIPVTGISVRNGSITNFSFGVNLPPSPIFFPSSGSIVERLRVIGCTSFGIIANGIVRDNILVDNVGLGGGGVGISATGIISGNFVNANREGGIEAGQGSTVIGNTVTNTLRDVGIRVTCPSNVTNNTALANAVGNLELDGTGCNNTNNVAP